MFKVNRNLIGFLIGSLLLAALSACSNPQTATNNSNSVSNATSTATNTTQSRSKDFPPLAASLADADFELLDGTKFKVSDKKGKVLLLNIWGTWCGPCREEMPHLIEMQNKYADKGLEIIGLNIGDGSGGPESNEQIKAFAEKMKLNYTIARSPGSATIQFYKISQQQVVPQTLLVDREGHLRGVFVGGGPRVIGSMKDTLDKTMSES